MLVHPMYIASPICLTYHSHLVSMLVATCLGVCLLAYAALHMSQITVLSD